MLKTEFVLFTFPFFVLFANMILNAASLASRRKKLCPCAPAQRRISDLFGKNNAHKEVSPTDVDLNFNFTVTQPQHQQNRR